MTSQWTQPKLWTKSQLTNSRFTAFVTIGGSGCDLPDGKTVAYSGAGSYSDEGKLDIVPRFAGGNASTTPGKDVFTTVVTPTYSWLEIKFGIMTEMPITDELRRKITEDMRQRMSENLGACVNMNAVGKPTEWFVE